MATRRGQLFGPPRRGWTPEPIAPPNHTAFGVQAGSHPVGRGRFATATHSSAPAAPSSL
jgi:hypothetical protein